MVALQQEQGVSGSTDLNVGEDAFAPDDLVACLVSGRDLMQHLTVVDWRAVQGGVVGPLHIACRKSTLEI